LYIKQNENGRNKNIEEVKIWKKSF
jgi:hypothetical protein